MRILTLSEESSGCGYYRITLPLNELARHGHDIIRPAKVGLDLTPTDEQLYEADLIVGQRVGAPGFDAYWRRWKAYSHVLFEADDDPFNLDGTNPAHISYLHPMVYPSMSNCIREADMVTVSTPTLAELIAEYNPNVRVLHNAIDELALEIPKQRIQRAPGSPNPITMVWTCSSSHHRDFVSVADLWRDFLIDNPRVDLHIVGYDYRPLFEMRAHYTGWQNIWSYYHTISQFDFGLAVIADTTFNRSKSPIKAMEYAAQGLTCIASDLPPYRDFIVDGKTGFLVSRREDWAARMRDLAYDPAMRAEMGAAAKERVRAYTIQRNWVDWRDVYTETIASRDVPARRAE